MFIDSANHFCGINVFLSWFLFHGAWCDFVSASPTVSMISWLIIEAAPGLHWSRRFFDFRTHIATFRNGKGYIEHALHWDFDAGSSHNFLAVFWLERGLLCSQTSFQMEHFYGLRFVMDFRKKLGLGKILRNRPFKVPVGECLVFSWAF